MNIDQLRKDLINHKQKNRGKFCIDIEENTPYTYRHVHNFLTKPDYNVTIDFVSEMQKFLND